MCPVQARPNTASGAAMPARRTCRRSSRDQACSARAPGVAGTPQAAITAGGSAGTRTAGRPNSRPIRTSIAAHGRMQMHVLVRVGMAEPQPGRGEGGELRPDLRRQLAAHARAEEIVHPEAQLVGRKPAARIDQIGDLRRRQHRRTLDHHQMQPHPQAGIAPRPRHRIGRRGAGDHQAGGSQHAFAVGLLDAFVYRFGEAEIVGSEGKARALPWTRQGAEAP